MSEPDAGPGDQEPRLPSLPPPSLTPPIPPLEATAPTDLVAPDPRQHSAPFGDSRSHDEFSPLRADPPPTLIVTWWLRWLIFVLLVGTPAVTLVVEYLGEADDVAKHPIVLALHVVAVGTVLAWSVAAMRNADRLVPASLYQRRSDPNLALLLWIAACAAPGVAALAFGLIDDRSSQPAVQAADVTAEATSDSIQVLLLAGVVLAALIVVWLPFRYHARQATRIGAPRRAMFVWFFAPLLAVVSGIAILSLGLHEELASGGLTPLERVVQVGVVYGLPMLLFALTTWRAITVFDEVIDLRWRRWKAEWEQTIDDFVRQPSPGPEDSPDLGITGD